MSNVYIEYTAGGVVTSEGGQIALLAKNSGGLQHWNFTDEGYFVLNGSSSDENCLSVLINQPENGCPVSLQPKGAEGYFQIWAYDGESSMISLVNEELFLNNGSGGPMGPTVYVDKAGATWTLPSA
jgi:hypothetical protein